MMVDLGRGRAQAGPKVTLNTHVGQAMTPAAPTILILAAGAGTRMRGGDKLMETIDQTPLLTRITRAAVATGVAVTVVLPPNRPERRAALAGARAQIVLARNAGQGMAESLTTGLAALPAAAPVMLLLADMPEITAEDLRQMLAAWRATPDLILRATDAEGAPGHPVCFPAWARSELMELRGDEGARAILRRHAGRMRHFTLPGRHATTDLDTPGDWQEWRASQSGTGSRARRPLRPDRRQGPLAAE